MEGAFKGLRPAVVAMITVAMLELGKEVFITTTNNISIKHLILFAVIFTLTKIQKKDNILLYIILGAITGIVFKM